MTELEQLKLKQSWEDWKKSPEGALWPEIIEGLDDLLVECDKLRAQLALANVALESKDRELHTTYTTGGTWPPMIERMKDANASCEKQLEILRDQLTATMQRAEKVEAQIKQLNEAWDDILKLQPIAGMSRPEVLRKIIDRAMAVEAACAEKDSALRACLAILSNTPVNHLRPPACLADFERWEHALSSDCGTNYVSKEVLKPAIKVLEQMGKGFGTATPTGYEIAKEIERLQKLTEAK